MFEFNGKQYIIDLDGLMDWISETPSTERVLDTTTTLVFPLSDDEMDEEEQGASAHKEVTENKSVTNPVFSNIRYDLIKQLLTVLCSVFVNEMNQPTTMQLQDLTFSQRLIFNTLLSKQIIKEVSK